MFMLSSEGRAAPNIIFVLCDDLGFGDLYGLHQHTRDNGAGGGVAGDGRINGTEEPFIYTPFLDRMAAEGAQLTRHYTSAPVCAPARGSLLQGRDQGHANIRDNSFDKVLEDNHTLGTVLQEAGYFTACVGKWGVGGSGEPFAGHPNRRGFDYFYGYLKHIDGHQHYPGNGGTIYEQEAPVTSGLEHAYTTDLFTAKAKQLVTERTQVAEDQPFFLYLAYDAPHAQLQVPTQAYPAGSGLSGGLSWPLNTNTGSNDSWIHPDYASLGNAAARHATMVRRLDTAMGDLLQTLRDLGIADNTLVVFSSDNGTHNEAGAGGSVAHNPRNFDSYGMLEGIKRDTWEGGIRVPTFAWWPGTIGDNEETTPAADSQRPSAFWDWMPTFAEAAGLRPPAWSNGVSLLPELTRQGEQEDKGYLYFEYNVGSNTPSYEDFPVHGGSRRGQMQVLFLDDTDGIRYKGVRYDVTDHEEDDFLIYEVDGDPGEALNLAPDKASLQRRMKDKVLGVRVDGDYNRPYLNGEFAPGVEVTTAQGLSWRAFEGNWPWVPNVHGLTPSAQGEAEGLDLEVTARPTDLVLEFTGYLQVSREGTYQFELIADGGAGRGDAGVLLWLHDANVVAADFENEGAPQRGSVRLQAGLHPLKVMYRQGAGEKKLTLRYAGPDLDWQEIPAAALLREVTPGPQPVAGPDVGTVPAGGEIFLNVLANDSDDGLPGALHLQSVGPSLLGEVAIVDSRIRYQAAAGVIGVDEFPYTISDGERTAVGWVTVNLTTEGDGTLLFSDFDDHGSVDGAGAFTGLSWSSFGVSTPAPTIALSAGATVQTGGAGSNAHRLSVDRNIDSEGPWSFEVAFRAERDLIATALQFDYQFTSNSGGDQAGPHPGSGVVTVALLSGGETLSAVTLPPLGTTQADSNSGAGIAADFEDVRLQAGTDYTLHFGVGSEATSGNNFALDNLRLQGSLSQPAVLSLTADAAVVTPGEDVIVSWETSGAGRLTLSDLSAQRLLLTTGGQGQAALDAGSTTLTATEESALLLLKLTEEEDGSGLAVARVLRLSLAGEASPGGTLLLELPNGSLPTDSPQLAVSGLLAGAEYRLFVSPDLIVFEPVGEPLIADEEGSITFADVLDFDPVARPRRFYQVRQVL
ncbi:sulfatase-like hydrolase/transferase [Roseibacillus ishigakijimensis]|uniref:Sulfatase-like hydrolase/transferase n=1 Tax=Roseibacillus ishigakijimensis TaxID=454146 RepID=A0A934RNS3_9BACT|nr:sulfatase-like hydrolase/transferase [Roseibacillus ishigakijimensis]